MVKGIPCSPGLGMGRAFVIKEIEISNSEPIVENSQIGDELQRLESAVKTSIKQLEDLCHAECTDPEKEAKILGAQIMILQDPVMHRELNRKITLDKKAALIAVKEFFEEKVAIMERIEDEYLRERANDIKDVGTRLFRNLLGVPMEDLGTIREETVLVGTNITPSQMVAANKEFVKGIISETGGVMSHTAIIARSKGIPAVMGVRNVLSLFQDGQIVMVDGSKGNIGLPANKTEEKRIMEKIVQYGNIKNDLLHLRDLPACTPDGYYVKVAANIASPEEALIAEAYGADRIGLFRTEFLYMNRKNLPEEEEQLEAYRKVTGIMGEKPVIIRTIDIGGDKEVHCLNLAPEENPFLGKRAIRLCFEEKKLFLTHLRAILRASSYGNIHIMYPMISSIEDFRRANVFLQEARESLQKEGTYFDPGMKAGVMIEVPSAAITADLIVKEADFCSIGTNDLVQYTLAVDRNNERVSGYYNSFHPSVIRLVKNIVEISHKAGKPAGLCGEVAGNPLASILLIGLGVNELSMNPEAILKVKKIIRSVDYEYAKAIADTVMTMTTSEEIEKYLVQILKDIKLSYLLEV